MNVSRLNAAKNKALIADVVGVRNPSRSSLCFALLFVITLGWLGDTLLGLLQALTLDESSNTWHSWSYYVVSMLPFPGVILWAWSRWQRAQQKVMQLSATENEIRPHAGVILFLSNITSKKLLEMAKSRDLAVFDDASYFSWTQCKRGLMPHKKALKKVWVISSPESEEQFPIFKGLFERMFEGVEFIHAGTANFEDMERLIQVTGGVFQDLPSNIDEVDVVIDITSGTKPVSVAGMMVSLVNDNREIQYVPTSERDAVKSERDTVKTYRYDMNLIGKGIKAKK